MDLISKEAVVNTIYKRDDRLKKHEVYRSKGGSIDLLGVLPEIRAIPSAFEGMTNGEVFKAIFPDLEVEIDETFSTVTAYFGLHEDYAENESRFDLAWWNAPYKGESEETNDKNHS